MSAKSCSLALAALLLTASLTACDTTTPADTATASTTEPVSETVSETGTETETAFEAETLPPEGNRVGNLCPGYEFSLLGDKGTFNPAANRGKVTVINFWGTWCDPCINELPHFDEIARTYADRVSVLAVHSSFSSGSAEAPETWVLKHYPDSPILFARDTVAEGKDIYYDTLGGIGTYPMTVILDADGVITCVWGGSMEKEELVEKVEQALGN